MVVIHSRIDTDVAYRLDANATETFVIHFRRNEVTPDILEKLKNDNNFAGHVDAGFLIIEENQDAPPAVAPDASAPAPAVDPRAMLPNEKKKDYNARMLALDEAEKDSAKFVADFRAMTQDEQDAMYGTLTPDEKALIDAARLADAGGNKG